eukprot:jgi/Mesen1/2150/ME000152S01244
MLVQASLSDDWRSHLLPSLFHSSFFAARSPPLPPLGGAFNSSYPPGVANQGGSATLAGWMDEPDAIKPASMPAPRAGGESTPLHPKREGGEAGAVGEDQRGGGGGGRGGGGLNALGELSRSQGGGIEAQLSVGKVLGVPQRLEGGGDLEGGGTAGRAGGGDVHAARAADSARGETGGAVSVRSRPRRWGASDPLEGVRGEFDRAGRDAEHQREGGAAGAARSSTRHRQHPGEDSTAEILPGDERNGNFPGGDGSAGGGGREFDDVRRGHDRDHGTTGSSSRNSDGDAPLEGDGRGAYDGKDRFANGRHRGGRGTGDDEWEPSSHGGGEYSTDRWEGDDTERGGFGRGSYRHRQRGGGFDTESGDWAPREEDGGGLGGEDLYSSRSGRRNGGRGSENAWGERGGDWRGSGSRQVSRGRDRDRDYQGGERAWGEQEEPLDEGRGRARGDIRGVDLDRVDDQSFRDEQEDMRAEYGGREGRGRGGGGGKGRARGGQGREFDSRSGRGGGVDRDSDVDELGQRQVGGRDAYGDRSRGWSRDRDGDGREESFEEPRGGPRGRDSTSSRARGSSRGGERWWGGSTVAPVVGEPEEPPVLDSDHDVKAGLGRRQVSPDDGADEPRGIDGANNGGFDGAGLARDGERSRQGGRGGTRTGRGSDKLPRGDSREDGEPADADSQLAEPDREAEIRGRTGGTDRNVTGGSKPEEKVAGGDGGGESQAGATEAGASADAQQEAGGEAKAGEGAQEGAPTALPGASPEGEGPGGDSGDARDGERVAESPAVLPGSEPAGDTSADSADSNSEGDHGRQDGLPGDDAAAVPAGTSTEGDQAGGLDSLSGDQAGVQVSPGGNGEEGKSGGEADGGSAEEKGEEGAALAAETNAEPSVEEAGSGIADSAVTWRGATWRGPVGRWLERCGPTSARVAVSELAGERECASPCSHGGACNPTDGTCRCKMGFGGPDCSQEDAPPACSTAASGSDSDAGGKWRPATCLGSCHPSTGICFCGGKTRFAERPIPPQCGFERQVEMGDTVWRKPDLQLLFADDESSPGWCNAPSSPSSGEGGGAEGQAQPDGTSSQITARTTCECAYDGLAGPFCERSTEAFCVSQCSGRGQCSHGFCECIRGWMGADCSIPSLTAALSVKESDAADSMPAWLQQARPSSRPETESWSERSQQQQQQQSGTLDPEQAGPATRKLLEEEEGGGGGGGGGGEGGDRGHEALHVESTRSIDVDGDNFVPLTGVLEVPPVAANGSWETLVHLRFCEAAGVSLRASLTYAHGGQGRRRGPGEWHPAARRADRWRALAA